MSELVNQQMAERIDHLIDQLEDLVVEKMHLEEALATARHEAEQWECTARRLAAESGWENSDYLEPDQGR